MIAAEQSDEWEEVAGWRGGLEALHARIAARFKRAEVRACIATWRRCWSG